MPWRMMVPLLIRRVEIEDLYSKIDFAIGIVGHCELVVEPGLSLRCQCDFIVPVGRYILLDAIDGGSHRCIANEYQEGCFRLSPSKVAQQL